MNLQRIQALRSESAAPVFFCIKIIFAIDSDNLNDIMMISK